jgi:peptidoglycan/xylan/chitin deacetylase (PgdA/CDA1 family)
LPHWYHLSSLLRAVVVLGAAALLAFGVIAYLERNTFARFDTLQGPQERSRIAADTRTDWRLYQNGSASRLAILLTDENSAWLGLAHGLKSIGVPFTITRDAAQATRHKVVLAYPTLSGRHLDEQALVALRRHVTHGGTLVATQVLGGGLQDLFGFAAVSESRSHHRIDFIDDAAATEPSLAWLNHPHERSVLLGNPDNPDAWMGTQVYEGADTVLARFDDGSPALVRRADASGGAAYALGFDLGFFIMRAHGDRNDQGYRSYANGYEPYVDVWLRWIRELYHQREPLAVTLEAAPEGKRLAAVVSFDVDYVDSMEHLKAYQDLLLRLEVPATFFIQTKYYRDFQDEGFFNDRTLGMIDSLQRAGMEIASHSVSHSDMYASVPIGDGQEAYPGYQPRVKAPGDTRNASVLGELRISKFLLEHLSDAEVVSFRPGYLATPPSLPQAMEASGYRFGSSETAGNVTTHLPYRANHDRLYGRETSIFEFPIAVEDEIAPVMDQRDNDAVLLARQIARYGGSFVILVHPNEIEHKYRFLESVIPQLQPFTWFGTLAQLGGWWSARDQLEIDVSREGAETAIDLTATAPIDGLSLQLPMNLKLSRSEATAEALEDNRLLIKHLPAGITRISLQ